MTELRNSTSRINTSPTIPTEIMGDLFGSKAISLLVKKLAKIIIPCIKRTQCNDATKILRINNNNNKRGRKR